MRWENMVESKRPQMKIRHMSIACWIPKATHTHTHTHTHTRAHTHTHTHIHTRAHESGRTLFHLQHNSSANEFTSYFYKNSNKFALVIKYNYIGAKLLFKRRTDVYFKWSLFFSPFCGRQDLHPKRW